MSTVKVNELSTYSGTDISIETGKTVSGTASQFKMTDVVQGDVLYGSAADTLSRLAPGTSGQYLQTTGAAANPIWAALPAGGLTYASQWRLTTGFDGDAAPIATNLEEVDAPLGFGVLGSSMTEASGIFTFPSTGYWLIHFHASFTTTSNNQWYLGWIYTTTDNSTYAQASELNQTAQLATASAIYPSGDCFYIFDVTSTSTHKCKFHIDIQTGTVSTEGNTDRNKTYMTFVRLGDT